MKITLSNGERYTLKCPEKIEEIDSDKNAIFVFDNMQIYIGKSDGVIDENGDATFCIEKEKSRFGMCMPYDRLIGWAYDKSEKQK